MPESLVDSHDGGEKLFTLFRCLTGPVVGDFAVRVIAGEDAGDLHSDDLDLWFRRHQFSFRESSSRRAMTLPMPGIEVRSFSVMDHLNGTP